MAETVIGPSIVVKGILAGEERVVVRGRVEGRMQVSDQVVVEREGTVEAEVSSESLRVIGTLRGNATATQRVELLPGSNVKGDLTAPRIWIQEGAKFKGQIDMGGDVLS